MSTENMADTATHRLKRPRLGPSVPDPEVASAPSTSSTSEEPLLRRPKFGARFLTESDDVYQHNAWDNVEWSDSMSRDAQSKVDKNSRVLVSDEVREKYEADAADYWNAFYSSHNNKFFKDRHWLFTEFPELAHLAHVAPDAAAAIAKATKAVNDGDDGDAPPPVVKDVAPPAAPEPNRAHWPDPSGDKAVFEIGCGVGNTVFPILAANQNPNLHVYAADYSAVAVDILKSHDQYDPERCTGFVCDISSDDALANCPIAKGSVDAITLIFVLSAISPERMELAIEHVASLLKPGGCIMFRDYGRHDLTQLRFKSGHAIEENFYARGDGTRVYFFTLEELKDIFTGCGLVVEECKYDRRMIVNRSRKLQMFRIWTQCIFRKPS